MNWKNILVQTRDRQTTGVATGATHHCRMEGCTGVRVTVRWPDGTFTHPCSKGLQMVDEVAPAFRIG